MKFILAFTVFALFATAVSAACPPYTRYDCVQMPNGKMSCGCR